MRLSRKQKIVCNLFLIVLLLALRWVVMDFPAYTPVQALKWKAQAQGLTDELEILYSDEFKAWKRETKGDMVFRCGDQVGIAYVYADSGAVYHSNAVKLMTKDVQRVVPLYQQNTLRPDAVYLWAQVPDAAEAECTIRMWGDYNVHTYMTKVSHYDWDETYTTAAVPNAYGVYRFPLEQNYPEVYDNGKAQEQHEVEQQVFSRFLDAANGGIGADSMAFTLTIHFRDSAGNMIETYEETIWDDLKEEAP